MYAFLLRYFNIKIAKLLTVIWFVLILILMYILSPNEDPGFLYLNL